MISLGCIRPTIGVRGGANLFRKGMGAIARDDQVAAALGSAASASATSTLQDEIQKRIKKFVDIQAEQKKRWQEIGGDSIKVKLPDGKEMEGKKWLTSPMDVALSISKSLAKEVLIAEVNGSLWDLTRPLEGDCSLKLFTFNDNEGRDTFWHSSAHILGQCLELEYGCKLCIGPCTTRGEGFYYDAYYDNVTLNEEHFKRIQDLAVKAVKERQPFERIEVSRQQALEIFAGNPFKIEIINELPEDKTITVYRCGPLVDLCRGPHVPNTSQEKESFLLDSLFSTLILMHSPGSCSFLPKGATIYIKLQEFIRCEYRKRGFKEVSSPNIFNMALWETSGHAANYKENMFVFEVEKQEFGLKPMNCPGHCLIFQHRVRSYRELPLRFAEFGVLHRNELSGALTGLTRVRRFCQDDAHIFCMESQVGDEVRSCLEFLDYVYGIFGFTFEVGLSTRPEKYLGEISTWDRAEKALTDALNSTGRPWVRNEGDGAFYGPKIDILVFDALKRKFQCATIQLDFQLPERFDLKYSAEDEAKRERPVIIHRAILGSVERMFAILLEHYAGKWPFWLSPRQAIVCTVSEKFNDYAEEVRSKLEAAGYEVECDTSDRKLPKKIREAQLAQFNYILVVGQNELTEGKVSVRTRDNDVREKMVTVEEIVEEFKQLTEQHVI